MVLFIGYCDGFAGGPMSEEGSGGFLLKREVYFVEIVEAVVDGLEEALSFMDGGGAAVIFGHAAKGEYNFIRW